MQSAVGAFSPNFLMIDVGDKPAALHVVAKILMILRDAFATTWAQHNMKAMHELDTDDVEWVNAVGHYWHGKDTLYKGHVAIHKGMSAGTSASVESATIRSIAPTVAIAVATMHFEASPNHHFPWATAAKSWASFTMIKRDGTWKIVHCRTLLPILNRRMTPSQV
jgi:uncharacterized protein (TIGR02246 family)